MSMVATKPQFSAENWREHYAAVRARLTVRVLPPRLKLAATLYPFPIGPRWHTHLYDHPIGPRPMSKRDIIDLHQASYPTSFAEMLGLEIIDYICVLRSVNKAELLGPRRGGPIVSIRHEVTYIIKCTERYSYPRIGQLMGGRDHTTALNSVRKWQGILDSGHATPTPFDPELAARVCRRRMRYAGVCDA